MTTNDPALRKRCATAAPFATGVLSPKFQVIVGISPKALTACPLRRSAPPRVSTRSLLALSTSSVTGVALAAIVTVTLRGVACRPRSSTACMTNDPGVVLLGAGLKYHLPDTRSTVPPVAESRLTVTGSLFGSVTQESTGISSGVSSCVTSAAQVISGGSLTTLTLMIWLAWLTPSRAMASNVSLPTRFAATKAKSPRAASAASTCEPAVVGCVPTDQVSGSPSAIARGQVHDRRGVLGNRDDLGADRRRRRAVQQPDDVHVLVPARCVGEGDDRGRQRADGETRAVATPSRRPSAV